MKICAHVDVYVTINVNINVSINIKKYLSTSKITNISIYCRDKYKDNHWCKYDY